jgi:TnpA family transposase
MSRLATIDMDVAQQPPDTWTAAWVCTRLIEAYRIEQRLPGNVRRKLVAPWPKHAYEFSDVVAQGEAASERVLHQWENTRGGVYAIELTRMEQAHEWLRVQLRNYAGERMCLAGWAACVAYGHSVRALMVRKHWSRSSFYRRVDTGSIIIAKALQQEGVKCV